MARIEVTAANFPGKALQGSGADTLVLVGGGTFDFAYVTLNGFSEIVVEAEAARYTTVKIAGDQLDGITSLSSAYEYTNVYLSGSTIDLRGKTFSKISGIHIDQDNATVTIDNLALGLRLNAFERQGETIVLDGPIATPTARDELHRHGFDTIVQGTTVWTDLSPTLSNLNGARLYVKESESVRLDPEGDAFVSDDKNSIAFLDISLSNKGYYFTMNHFEIGSDFLIASDYFSQSLYYKGSAIASIRSIGHQGTTARISFNASSTPEIVSEFLQNLAYTPGNFIHYRNVDVAITAFDQGGRRSGTALFNVTAEVNWAPTEPTLTGTSIVENAVGGTVVGTLKATDANNDPVSYQLLDDAGGRFIVQGDKIVASGNVPLDHEVATEHFITVVASDGKVSGQSETFKIAILNVRDEPNVAPSQPSLTGASIAENASSGAVVGILKATDANGDLVTYKLTSDAEGRFSVVGNQVVVSGTTPLDFEKASTHTISIVASDGDMNSLPATFAISVTDVMEKLPGTKGKDILAGTVGQDLMNGYLGNDTLTGGGGKDVFAFTTKLGKSNIDRLTDFLPKQDKIHLDNAIFKKLPKVGALKKEVFYQGSAAHDKDDKIIYNQKTGALYYDLDGTGASKAVHFATLSNKANLKYSDFLVI
ncbi:cadherin domain-containing protein [Microvirga arsenatis]|uniref:Cadherin domain-containing protein n=1 Tax=Microvirga arsenatis TaxID=2692265 RepID=A0ABW9YXU1_9HYPH|nr:cadherin domain-containing protein [Microvirga arsenatis]NBJ09510.1 hypothetical protein [Microvirga arsenatis]NBJ23631.1 hypothetical protein [Microvirga arsenatis]